MKILILGGTGEARDLAGRLVALGHKVTTSLAGRTTSPALPEGELRVGKYRNKPKQKEKHKAAGIERLVDATHPYAGLISINAVAASQQTGIPLVRFMRPAWREPEGANWQHVPDLYAAAKALPPLATVLVTTGHEDLTALLDRDDCRFVVRLIEPPAEPLPRHARLILSRPPYTLEGETMLFRSEGITHFASIYSGGVLTASIHKTTHTTGAQGIMGVRPAFGPAREVGRLDEAVAAIAG